MDMGRRRMNSIVRGKKDAKCGAIASFSRCVRYGGLMM
jgi:hypothetical protein